MSGADAAFRRWPTSQPGRIPPPPFSAAALKLSALRNARVYRQLFDSVGGSGAPGLSGRPQDGSGDTNSFAAQFRVSQGLLLIDARRLVESSLYLVNDLRARRVRLWFIHCLIAIICQASLSSRLLRQVFHVNLPSWASFAAYPVAGYRILKHERKISSAEAVHNSALGLCELVETGQPIDDRDLECFTGADWDDTPWQEMEPK